MPAEPSHPFPLLLSNALVRIAAQLVPAAQQKEWRQEWLAELWHRCEFLRHSGMWNRREGLRLIRDSLGAFPDAVYFSRQDAVHDRLRECIRSPWTCLAAFASVLVLVLVFSGGVPATRALFHSAARDAGGRLVYIWSHPIVGGGDRGVPSDLPRVWKRHGELLESVAGFTASHAILRGPHAQRSRPLVIASTPALFDVLRARAALGSLNTSSGLILTDAVWRSSFHADPRIIGSILSVGTVRYPVAAVLKPGPNFLSRQPSIYVVVSHMPDNVPQMAIGRARPRVTQPVLERQLGRIAEAEAFYFFRSDIRVAFVDDALLTPVWLFVVAVLTSILMMIAVSHLRLRRLRDSWKSAKRRATITRISFFFTKTVLALSCIFIAGLEASRSQSAILFGSHDPAGGPFLLWVFILGNMGVLFWSVADQRARCRVCLRLLCFPVRVGCPGCLLLEWSGTELLCTEGHGLLHVPHLAPSWDDESDRWIALDESWQGLFAGTK